MTMHPCRPNSISENGAIPLDRIVQAYLDHNAPSEERYLRFYATQPSLPDAISKAALAELPNAKRFSHQRRIPRQVLEKARAALLKQDYQGLKSFDYLYLLVARVLRPIRGIGSLTIYDTAHRLGAYLKLSPEFVYLHAGTRIGAKALNLGANRHKLPLAAFPPAFHRLRPEQIEDCLCIYKRELSQVSKSYLAAHCARSCVNL